MLRLFKTLLFSLIPLLVLVFAAEVLLRCIYFQKRTSGFSETAIQAALISVINKMEVRRALKEISENYTQLADLTGLHYDPDQPNTVRTLREALVQSLYAPIGVDMLSFLRQQYRSDFEAFVQAVRQENSKLLVVYIPSARPAAERASCREFYSTLCISIGVDFLDVTEKLLFHPDHKWMFLPEDAHPSYFGNQMIALSIAEFIENEGLVGEPKTHELRPAIMGDHKPNQRFVFKNAIPYWFITNGEGFRNERNLNFPKNRPRILCVGDSFTYGSSVSNIHTYPHQLEQKLQQADVINAGYPGYSIPDQLALYTERARFVEADWVILQVLDNDISDLFSFYRNHFARDHRTRIYSFTEEELRFFQAVKHSTSPNP